MGSVLVFQTTSSAAPAALAMAVVIAIAARLWPRGDDQDTPPAGGRQ